MKRRTNKAPRLSDPLETFSDAGVGSLAQVTVGGHSYKPVKKKKYKEKKKRRSGGTGVIPGTNPREKDLAGKMVEPLYQV